MEIRKYLNTPSSSRPDGSSSRLVLTCVVSMFLSFASGLTCCSQHCTGIRGRRYSGIVIGSLYNGTYLH